MQCSPDQHKADKWIRSVAKPLVLALCLTPLAWLAWRWFGAGLGANPIEAVIRFLGDWAMRFLLMSLAITPLVMLTGWTQLYQFRRMLALVCFAYATLHIAGYVGLDQFFDWPEIWADITKRRYITVGLLAFLLMVPLALTSTDAMVRRLSLKRWRRLHWLVYPIAVLVFFHYMMMLKTHFSGAWGHGLVLLLLLIFRLRSSLRARFAARGDRRSGASSESLRIST